MPTISTGVASPLPSSGARAINSGVQRAIRRSISMVERGRVERGRAPAHGVGGVEMLHRQGVVAKIVRRLADREVKPQALRRFQPRRGEGGFHPLQQTVVSARDGATPDQIVVASRQQRRDRDRAREAFAGLVETAELREQIAEQIVRHGVRRVERQRLPQHLFGFLDRDPRSAAPAPCRGGPTGSYRPVAAARRKQPIASLRWPSV